MRFYTWTLDDQFDIGAQFMTWKRAAPRGEKRFFNLWIWIGRRVIHWTNDF